MQQIVSYNGTAATSRSILIPKNQRRAAFAITNEDATNTIRIGGSDITSAIGLLVQPKTTLIFELGDARDASLTPDVYVIRTTADCAVSAIAFNR